MTILFLDFETYYDSEYSLSKMAPPNYILDDRFEVIGCACAVDDQPSEWVDGPELENYLSRLDWTRTTTVAFNALFDSCILTWQYRVSPRHILCTMRMAASLRGHTLQGNSLAAVSKSLGLGAKGTIIESAKGLRRADMIANPTYWRDYQAYANNDNELNRGIFLQLAGEFLQDERKIMSLVLKCAVEPKFKIDTKMLTEHLAELKELKAQMLINAGAETTMDAINRAERLEFFARSLRSTPKFKALLEARGVDIVYKPSLTDPTRSIPAFSKTDEFMSDLQTHDDLEIQALAEARLGVRSTIEETRGKRILSIAECKWPDYCAGNMPIPLKYSGAHTHRLAGDWKLNMQNLPSSRQAGSKLRKSLIAPPGHKVVVADKSQIECRINAYICGQWDLVELFRIKGDPYAKLASYIFFFSVDRKVHKVEGFIGKTGVLGCGFGCGPDKFYNMVVRSARTMGMDMNELLKVWTPDLAKRTVKIYRNINHQIKATWAMLDHILGSAWIGQTMPVMFGSCEIGRGYVMGPNGLKMNYGNPRYENNEYWYDYGKRKHKLYGAKLLENIVQFLARINVMHDALRIADRGFLFAAQSHDELVFVVLEDQAETCLAVALEEMSRAPSWAPDIPLSAEGAIGDSYGDAK